jgi:hypothetical protein
MSPGGVPPEERSTLQLADSDLTCALDAACEVNITILQVVICFFYFLGEQKRGFSFRFIHLFLYRKRREFSSLFLYLFFFFFLHRPLNRRSQICLMRLRCRGEGGPIYFILCDFLGTPPQNQFSSTCIAHNRKKR